MYILVSSGEKISDNFISIFVCYLFCISFVVTPKLLSAKQNEEPVRAVHLRLSSIAEGMNELRPYRSHTRVGSSNVLRYLDLFLITLGAVGWSSGLVCRKMKIYEMTLSEPN